MRKVKNIILRHTALEKDLSSGDIEPRLLAKKSKEYSNFGNIISIAREYLNFEKTKMDLEQILKDKNNDTEMVNMAKKDLSDMEKKKRFTKVN